MKLSKKKKKMPNKNGTNLKEKKLVMPSTFSRVLNHKSIKYQPFQNISACDTI